MPSIIMRGLHVINLHVFYYIKKKKVHSMYTMTAQHKSNIGCAFFTCIVVDLLLCETKIPAECPK